MGLTGSKWSVKHGGCYGFQSASKIMLRFHASTLPRFHASTLPRFIRGFCSAALIGASLSLAACGSGGSESTDPARKSLLDQREKELNAKETTLQGRETTVSQRETTVSQKEKQQRTKDQQQAAKDEELNNRPPKVVTKTVTLKTPSPFAGFSSTETVNIANMVNEVAGTNMIIRYHNLLGGIAGHDSPNHSTRKLEETKIIHVTPTVSNSQFESYTIDFLNPGALTEENALNSQGKYFYYRGRESSLTKYFGFDKSSYTATNLNLGLAGDNWDSKILKAEVDTNKDNTKNAKMHVELAAGWPETTAATEERTDQWLVYGFWLQMPKDNKLSLDDYNFGAFSNNNYIFVNITSVEGSATYRGSLLGLHTSIKDNEAKLSRLTGEVTATANFGNRTQNGNIRLLADNLQLDSEEVSGQMTLNHDLTNNEGYFKITDTSIDGISYQAVSSYVFTGRIYSPNIIAPNGLTGVIKGVSDTHNSRFVAGFGATRVQE